jgi:hypothetical protein
LSLFGLTVRNLRALARVDLDGLFVGSFVFLLLAMMLSVVDGMVRGTGGVFALLGNLVEDAGFSFFFGGVVRHGERVCGGFRLEV